MYHALKSLGKNVVCVLVRDEPIGPELAFMPGSDSMVPAVTYEGPCTVFMGLDVPSRERIGAAVDLLDRSELSITIDHHAADQRMCDYVYVDPDCAAASILVWDVVKLLLEEPPLESALCAYVGLATDTGCFRFQNSDSKAFAAAAELIGFGVDPAYVATKSFQNRSLASLKLEGCVIDRLEIIVDGQAAISWVTKADFDRVGGVKSDAEPLIDTVRELTGIRVACMLREQDGKIRGSLRSKDETDVSVLARRFGGGGHHAAAGFTLDMTLSEALSLMKTSISELLRS
jgi:phosphoesterase RecJ-like protein